MIQKLKRNLISIIICTNLFIGSSFSQQNNLNYDNSTIDSLRNIILLNKNDSLKVDALWRLAHGLNTSNIKEAEKYALKALDLAVKTNNKIGQYSSKIELSKCYELKGKYKEAISILEEVITDTFKHKYEHQNMVAKFNLAYIYQKQGDYKNALSLMNETIKYAKKNNKKEFELSILTNLGIIYFKLNEYNTAIEYYKKTLSFLNQKNDQKKIAKIYNNIGNFFIKVKEFDSSIYYYTKAIEIGIIMNDKNGLGARYSNIGGVYFYTKNYLKALDFFYKSLDIRKQIQDKEGIIISLKNIATTNRKLNKNKKALIFALEALKIANEINVAHLKINVLKEIAEIYAILENANNTISYFKQFLELNDSINNLSIKNELAELKIKYKITQKEKENAELAKKIKINELELSKEKNDSYQNEVKLERRNLHVIILTLIIVFLIASTLIYIRYRKIIEAQKTNELEHTVLRMQMNPHFIFNSLNSIQHLYIDKKEDIANEYLGDFSYLLRFILEKSSKKLISLKEEIHILNLYLQLEQMRLSNMINYDIKIDNTIDLFNTKIPPLIIQPFVENSIWHGILPTKKKGNIKISFKDNKSFISCCIEDNGIGINKSKPNYHQSKGISITQKRLGGKNAVTIKTKKDGGTLVILKIKYYD